MSPHQLPDALPDNVNEELIIWDDERGFLEKCRMHNVKDREKLILFRGSSRTASREQKRAGATIVGSGREATDGLRVRETAAMRW